MIIYKYKLHQHGIEDVAVPRMARILSVQFQDDELVMWAMVRSGQNEKIESLRIGVFYTGEELPAGMEQMKYLGTAQRSADGIIVHVFNCF